MWPQSTQGTALGWGSFAPFMSIVTRWRACHDLEMTGEYTFVTAERQNELTRRIQQKLSVAAKKTEVNAVVPPVPSTPTPQMPPTVSAKVPAPLIQ